MVEDYERAISYNIMKYETYFNIYFIYSAHNTIQRVEKDCESRLIS